MKCKICPKCKKVNAFTASECEFCMYDLINTPITEDQEPRVETKNTVNNDSEQGKGRVKICPHCGHINPYYSSECEDCNADLIDVPISEAQATQPEPDDLTNSQDPSTLDGPSELELKPEPSVEPQPKSFSKPMRYCPKCGREYPFSFSKCEDCGSHLLIRSKKQDALKRLIIRSEDGMAELELEEGTNAVIGRAEKLAKYLEEKTYVSGRQIRITVESGLVYIEHIGKTNPTLIGDHELEYGKPYMVKPGELITLGGRIGQGYSPKVGYFRIVEGEDTNE